MTSFIARKGEKYSQLKDEKQLKTYIIRKRKRLSGVIYRTQNKHLRPFCHVGTIKSDHENKLEILKEIFNQFGEGDYVILHFPPKRKTNGFQLFWKGRLPTTGIIIHQKEE